MKKLISLIMAILLLLPALTVYGSEEDRVMQIVSCPEQNFSTVCRPEYTFDYTPDGGLLIRMGDGEEDGYFTIFKTDAPGADFAAETYFNNAYLNMLESSYGENLVDPGEYTVYSFGDREMPGRLALYLKGNVPWMRLCLYDLEEDYFVRYEAFSVFEETAMQNAVNDLSDAVRYFQPDAKYYSGSSEEEPTEAGEPEFQEPVDRREPEIAGPSADREPDIKEPVDRREPEIAGPSADREPDVKEPADRREPDVEAPAADREPDVEVPAADREPGSEEDEETGVEIYYPNMPEEAEAGPNFKFVSCTAENFSVKVGIWDRVEYKESNGMTSFLDSEIGGLWVRVHREAYDPDFDAETFFRDEITPSMEYIYKDNEYRGDEFGSFTVAGKTVWGQEYHFSLGENDYTRRVMFYQTENDLVRFEAQYTEDTYKSVMYDLEMVMNSYEPDAHYYR